MNSGQYLKDVKAQIRETDVEAVRKMVEARQGQGGRRQRRRSGPDRRAREGRVDRGLHPGRALDPARLARAAHRGPGSGADVGDRPLLRGRHALGAGGASRWPSSATPTSSRWRAASRAWKRAGLNFDRPFVMTQEQSLRYARHTMLPEVGEAGQAKLLQSKVLLPRRGRARRAGGPVPGGGRRRHASASSTTTWSTRRTCSARSSTRPSGSACRRSSRRSWRSTSSTPT